MSILVNTVAPVVVKPETDSKKASRKFGSAPHSVYGSAPNSEMHIQPTATSVMASRRLIFFSFTFKRAFLFDLINHID